LKPLHLAFVWHMHQPVYEEEPMRFPLIAPSAKPTRPCGAGQAALLSLPGKGLSKG